MFDKKRFLAVFFITVSAVGLIGAASLSQLPQGAFDTRKKAAAPNQLSLVGYQGSSDTTSDIKPTLLTVVGEGKSEKAPEVAQFTIAYLVSGQTVSSALDAEKNMRQSIIALLIGNYAVQNADIQVAYPKVVAANTAGGVNYQVVNSLDVSFGKISLFDDAISKLYQLGGKEISISNIIFTTKNPRDLENEALANAFKDAQTSAGKMAAAAGKSLSRLVSIAGSQTQAVGTLTTQANNSGTQVNPQGQTTSTPGVIKIVRNMTLVYELR